MKKIIFSILLIFFVLNGTAQNQAWQISSSNISFKIKNAGFTVNGFFGGLNGTIQFDATKNSGNKIDVNIYANTINTDNSTRDGHLKKEEYFSVEKFDKIYMSAVSFTKEPDGRFKGLFTLTVKGVSKIIPIIFMYTEQKGQAKFAGNFTINRLDFKVGTSSFILSDNVTININVTCIKK